MIKKKVLKYMSIVIVVLLFFFRISAHKTEK